LQHVAEFLLVFAVVAVFKFFLGLEVDFHAEVDTGFLAPGLWIARQSEF
jgi:hypothetical protein